MLKIFLRIGISLSLGLSWSALAINECRPAFLFGAAAQFYAAGPEIVIPSSHLAPQILGMEGDALGVEEFLRSRLNKPDTDKKNNRGPLIQFSPIPIPGSENWKLLPLIGNEGVFGADYRDFNANYSFSLVKAAAEFLKRNAKKNSRILVLGAGSGYEVITLALEFPDLTIDGTDIVERALEVGKQNAILHKVESRVRFFKSDMFDNVEDVYDMIIFNAPRAVYENYYLGRFDPLTASRMIEMLRKRPDLFDVDGLLLSKLLYFSKSHLVPGGPVFLMTEEKFPGYSSYPFTTKLHFSAPWTDERRKNDDSNFGIHEIHFIEP